MSREKPAYPFIIKGRFEEFLDLTLKARETAKVKAEAEVAPNTNGQSPPEKQAVDLDTADERLILREIGLDVLGELPTGKVAVYSEFHRKMDELRDTDRMSYGRLKRLAGPVAKAKVHTGVEDVPGVYRLTDVRDAIELLAGYNQLDLSELTGAGCWRHIGEDGQETDEILAVGRGVAVGWDGEQSRRVVHPRCGDRFLHLSDKSQWFEADVLERQLHDYSTEWASSVVQRLMDVFKPWRIQHPRGSEILAGAILATFIQTTWVMRPHVAISGKTHTGKTTLFSWLEAIFGKCSVRGSRSTEAGVRQAIQRSAVAVLLDEFEKSKSRADILKLARAATRGDTIRMGTQDQGGKSFVIQHVFWIAAIELGLQDAADRNRFILLEILPAAEGEFGKMRDPEAADGMADLGAEALAVAMHCGAEARRLAVELKQTIKGADSRIVEGMAVIASILSVARGEQDKAGQLLQGLMAPYIDNEPVEGDEGDLLQAILAGVVRMEGGREVAVAEVLSNRETNSEGVGSSAEEEAMERHGVAVVSLNARGRYSRGADGAKGVFVDPKVAIRRLLSGTDWFGKDLQQLLMRVSGAEKTRRRIAGHNSRGVMIPFSVVQDEYLSERPEQPINDSLFE